MSLSKSARVWILIIAVGISLLLVSNVIPVNKEKGIGFGNGLVYGLDFAGGVQIQLKLERPVDSNVMGIEKGILENRLNAMGLKDIPVRPWGDQYILIQVAGASPDEISSIEHILKQQARFEARIDGELAMEGSEVSVDLSPQGRGVTRTEPSDWFVAIRNSREGGERFCSVGRDKKNYPIDMFLDRPENTIMVMTEGKYSILQEQEDQSGDSYVRIIENRSLTPVVVVKNDTLNLTQLQGFQNYSQAILAGDEEEISDQTRNELEERNFSTRRIPKLEEESYEEWMKRMLGLKSSPTLRCDPCTQCKYEARITGQAATYEGAKKEMDETQILLSSGNLPAKAEIESKFQIPQRQAKGFLKYSFLIGVIAITTVALIIFIRYRKLQIVIPVLITGLSEIIIILGFASLISWELDLAAVAGIIAAVGTGVDHQIIITDESVTQKGKRKEISLTERIRRAFFIIFTAAATTIAVMIPVFMIQALKGFALTTITGVVIGIFITRPAYARIIEEILRE